MWGLFVSFSLSFHCSLLSGKSSQTFLQSGEPFTMTNSTSSFTLLLFGFVFIARPHCMCACAVVPGAWPCLTTRARRRTSSPSPRATSSASCSWLARSGLKERSTAEWEYFLWTSHSCWSLHHSLGPHQQSWPVKPVSQNERHCAAGGTKSVRTTESVQGFTVSNVGSLLSVGLRNLSVRAAGVNNVTHRNSIIANYIVINQTIGVVCTFFKCSIFFAHYRGHQNAFSLLTKDSAPYSLLHLIWMCSVLPHF